MGAVTPQAEALHGTRVGGCGPRPCRAMIVGERPGITEAQGGRPFIGRAGAEQNRYLKSNGANIGEFYRTNVCKDYAAGDPDPTAADIAYWTPELIREVREIAPSIIIAVGRFAVRWFLGDAADMEAVHGIPHRAGAFDPARADRANGAIVMPCYHPALGFYDDDSRTLIASDYERAVAAVRGRLDMRLPEDEFVGIETYIDVGGAELGEYLAASEPAAIGLDTEGVPRDTWSIQVSAAPGTAYVLRCARDDFRDGIAAIQRLASGGTTVCIHNGMYDVEMCRMMGLDLSGSDVRLFDSMYAAYIMRTEPQGLKPLAYRWVGMRMASYDDVIGDIALNRQLDYLGSVLELEHEWPKPDPRIEYNNNGTSRVYTPQPIARRAEAILVDYYSGKVDKDGDRVDPMARWRKVDRDQRLMVEERLGPMPAGSLADLPLDKAVYYSGRDADATLRLHYRLVPELKSRNLSRLMDDGMAVLPVFEEMQSTGMPASRAHFVKLSGEMWETMCRLQARISNRYYGGAPFNPASADQVAAIMRRRGLVGEKRSKKTNKVSTAKKSIEHLRYEDDAIKDIIDWREHQKIRDAFCKPILDRIPPDQNIYPVRCSIKTTRVTSRRISASDPNLTAIPVRNELGKRVRDGYLAPDGQVFGSWDLAAAEMRVMAGLSKDPLLVRLFAENRDPHAETAARIFGIPLQDVDEMKHRYPAKRAAFGIITSITGSGLLDQLRMFGCDGWDVDKCDRLVREWLKIYSGVASFMARCRDEVRRSGVIRDMWGMPRYLTGVWSEDRKVASEAERAASSHVIQGTAQGAIQRSMAWLRPRINELRGSGIDVRWRLQIHDSIVLTLDEYAWDLVDSLVVEALTEHHDLNMGVPMRAKGSKSQSWGGLK